MTGPKSLWDRTLVDLKCPPNSKSETIKSVDGAADSEGSEDSALVRRPSMYPFISIIDPKRFLPGPPGRVVNT